MLLLSVGTNGRRVSESLGWDFKSLAASSKVISLDVMCSALPKQLLTKELDILSFLVNTHRSMYLLLLPPFQLQHTI